MNVLILTPDRVGSTLLQRLITVHMLAAGLSKPTVNLHELTNGLMEYYSPVYQQSMLTWDKNLTYDKRYHQSLSQITELLDRNDHFKTARLAHYHIINRNDPIADQAPFYRYINDNFFIISARRENLLEHALSWAIQAHTKHLNLYTHQEKINTFAHLYKQKIHVDPESLVKHLDRYLAYLDWVDQHFQINSIFKYERDLPIIESYISSLSIFNQDNFVNWQTMFGLTFNDWNRCHYLLSNTAASQPGLLRAEFKNLPATLVDCYSGLSTDDREFINNKADMYKSANGHLDVLIQNKNLVTGIPIKLNTFAEKQVIVKNFDECVAVYNRWTDSRNYGVPYSSNEIKELTVSDQSLWGSSTSDALLPLLTQS